jgi:ribosomal protein L7Ae-like RNA K-turn-binding protein
VDDAVERKLLALVGLGLRGRLAVVGVEQVRDAARRGKLALAVVASDASRHSLEKVMPLLQAKGIRILAVPSAAVLGAAVGRESTAAVGIVDRQLARGIAALVEPDPAVSREPSSPGAR